MPSAPLIPKIPPLRTDIQEPQQSSSVNRPPAQGVSNGANTASNGGSPQHRTSKEWYYYWSKVGDQVVQNTQTLNGLVTYGPHAGRPDPSTMPNGALAVESDRGVIYQNELIQGVPTWFYVAGTMWGTMSPDQRPTDLGAHDAGFDFRTTDQPAREFIWSQAGWIEATPARFGTHAARLAVNVAEVIEQMLWVETDRGVLYQLMLVSGTTPVWQYIAGTMWGTMSPDQRPTDLGTHDAGFDYRSTDAPPREFIWSQAAWVETGDVVQNQGSSLTVRGVLNFTGAGVSAADDPVNLRTNITISGGGGTGGAVSSVFGRTGAIVATTGDYSASMVTNAVSTASTYADPAWLTALAWSKIAGTPSVSSYQTPWLSNINGGAFGLGNVASIGIGLATTPQDLLHIYTGVGWGMRVQYSGDGSYTRISSSGLAAYTSAGAGSQLFINGSGGNVAVGSFNTPGYQLQLWADSAAKPSTNTWSVPSDIRLKQNVRPLEGGLEIINRLEPIVGEYNGKSGTPRDGRVVSLDAAKLREILPHAVSSVRGKLDPDDQEETDILGVNTHEILYHLVLAVQQLAKK